MKMAKGETVKAKRTVKVDGRHAIIKGRKYTVNKVKQCCCHQAVDVGYRHYRPMVLSCGMCGKKRPSSKTIMIPSSYFLRKGEKLDPLMEALDDIERTFRKANDHSKKTRP